MREQDLWDFADDSETPSDNAPASEETSENPPEAPAEHAPQPVTLTPRGLRKEELPFRSKQPPKLKKNQKGDSRGDDAAEILPISIAKTPAPPPRKVEDAFDDLDASDDSPSPEIPPKPAEAEKTPDPAPAKPEAEPAAAEAVEKSADTTESKETADEPAAAEVPASLIPKVAVSKVEKIALISVLALLALGSIFFIANSVYKIPEKHVWLKESDFPIKGKSLEAVKAQTYWRAPATGEGRIGTALLPVIELDLAGGPAAVRVFFRNAKGESAGDAFTKNVSGSSSLKIAGTAGFEDLGMHAAYRTTDTDRWIVEVYEGPSIDAPIHTFKKLFELPISTDRR